MPADEAVAIARQECARLGLEWREPIGIARVGGEYSIASPCHPLVAGVMQIYPTEIFYVDPFTGDVRHEHFVVG